MKSVTSDQLTQDLAVLRKRMTGKTAPYDRTVEVLANLPEEDVAPTDIASRLLSLTMSVDRSVVEVVKASVGAVHDSDVKFTGATVGYLLKIARVLYAEK